MNYFNEGPMNTIPIRKPERPATHIYDTDAPDGLLTGWTGPIEIRGMGDDWTPAAVVDGALPRRPFAPGWRLDLARNEVRHLLVDRGLAPDGRPWQRVTMTPIAPITVTAEELAAAEAVVEDVVAQFVATTMRPKMVPDPPPPHTPTAIAAALDSAASGTLVAMLRAIAGSAIEITHGDHGIPMATLRDVLRALLDVGVVPWTVSASEVGLCIRVATDSDVLAIPGLTYGVARRLDGWELEGRGELCGEPVTVIGGWHADDRRP